MRSFQNADFSERIDSIGCSNGDGRGETGVGGILVCSGGSGNVSFIIRARIYDSDGQTVSTTGFDRAGNVNNRPDWPAPVCRCHKIGRKTVGMEACAMKERKTWLYYALPILSLLLLAGGWLYISAAKPELFPSPAETWERLGKLIKRPLA